MTNNVSVNSLQKFNKVLNIAPDRDDSKSDTRLKTESEEPREKHVGLPMSITNSEKSHKNTEQIRPTRHLQRCLQRP